MLLMTATNQVTRRAFLGATAALISSRFASAQQPPTARGYPLVIPGYFGSKPGVQLGTQLPANASEDDMRMMRQLGVEWVMTILPPQESTLENYQAVIKRF